ncbi:hypothetical protein NIES2109_44310 [Nostoc sp. HK-01]|nr:hypothetical protein NIES2109_44310 [Nostoc sp. HK-01]
MTNDSLNQRICNLNAHQLTQSQQQTFVHKFYDCQTQHLGTSYPFDVELELSLKRTEKLK